MGMVAGFACATGAGPVTGSFQRLMVGPANSSTRMTEPSSKMTATDTGRTKRGVDLSTQIGRAHV